MARSQHCVSTDVSNWLARQLICHVSFVTPLSYFAAEVDWGKAWETKTVVTPKGTSVAWSSQPILVVAYGASDKCLNQAHAGDVAKSECFIFESLNVRFHIRTLRSFCHVPDWLHDQLLPYPHGG